MEYHYWVGPYYGYLMSTVNDCPIKKPQHRLTYIGFTDCLGWPKVMNTGRVFHKNVSNKIRKKNKKYKKEAALMFKSLGP